MGLRGEVFTTRVKSGKRTYFFNVKENRNGDLFLNIVESKKHNDHDFERHSIIIFKEDMDPFKENFMQAVNYMEEH
jgi:hypothetical protein